jgi:hypothetical protein
MTLVTLASSSPLGTDQSERREVTATTPRAAVAIFTVHGSFSIRLWAFNQLLDMVYDQTETHFVSPVPRDSIILHVAACVEQSH